MARGQRKTAKEKLTDAMNKVQAEIEQYETALESKRGELADLAAGMKDLELAELSGVLDSYGMSIQEVKQLIEAAVS